MEGKFMNIQNGVEWIQRQYDKQVSLSQGKKRPSGQYTTKVMKADVPEDIVLEFAQYDSERTHNPATGKVTGSKRVLKQELERLTVPAGTDVRIYRAPNRAAPGDSVATFFLSSRLQVVFKRDRDLVHTNL